MTDDIVKRLRNHCLGGSGTALEAAADEIERLRAEVERLTRERDEEKAAANDALQHFLAAERKAESAHACCDSYADENQRLFDRAEAAERQVEKLREALEHYVRQDDAHGLLYPWTNAARSALAETEETDEN